MERKKKNSMFVVFKFFCFIQRMHPPSSLIDSIASLKVKTMEGEGVGVRFLARSTLGVEGRVGTLK
jgi:hypothetical protein